MERPEIYTDNYNSLEEWIELRKRNEEFVYPQFFVPFIAIYSEKYKRSIIAMCLMRISVW